jgi:hypothetical protein
MRVRAVSIRTPKRSETMIVVAEIDICDDCMINADGDPAMGDAASQYRCAVAAADTADKWGDLAQHIHTTCDDECGFSWSPCEACGSTLGGTRHPAVVLGPDPV